MAAEIEVNDGNFQQEIAAHKGVAVVDFFGTWCGPCRAFAPAFASFAAEAPAGVKVAKADVDQSEQSAAANGIMSVPTVVFFKDGKAVDKVVGGQSKAFLLDKVQKLLG
jgi:thioredoxin 1